MAPPKASMPGARPTTAYRWTNCAPAECPARTMVRRSGKTARSASRPSTASTTSYALTGMGAVAGAPESHSVRRQRQNTRGYGSGLGVDVFLVQKLGSDEDGLACGSAGTRRGFEDRAVVAFDVSPLSVKDNDGARNPGLGSGPIERDETRTGGRPRGGGYAETFSGYRGGWLLRIQQGQGMSTRQNAGLKLASRRPFRLDWMKRAASIEVPSPMPRELCQPLRPCSL